jgi:hypothetical protein
MRFSNVDWTILWKLHHLRFFWIYLTLGIPLKGLLAWHLEAGSAVKTSASAVLSSFASSVASTWFPILPIACTLMLNGLVGGTAGQSLFVSLPIVALAMGIEAAFLDWVLFRVLMKESVKRQFVWVLIANVLNASIALGIGLAWVAHHPTMMIATLTY